MQRRLFAWMVALVATIACLAPPAQAQSASDYTQGVAVSGTTATIWFKSNVNTSWVDVHYQLNGGGQQNLRMSWNAGTARYEQNVLTPVASGNTLSYFFTYNNGTPAYDTPTFTYTVGSSSGGGGSGGGGSSGPWNGQTTFQMVNATNGQWPDSQVYWAIIGKDWNTGQFVHVDSSGRLVPMSTADNGALSKGGVTYTNYFYSLAQTRSITIPPINSARLLMSVGSPMYIRVVVDGAGNIGYAGANIENPSDPNQDVIFDFGEFAILPPGNANQGIFINTTRVDQFGFPVKLRVQGGGGFDQTVGEPLTESRATLFSRYQSDVPAEFKSLAQPNFPNVPPNTRIIAPAHFTFGINQPNGHYLDDYVNAMWSQFSSQDLVFTLQNMGTFRGHVYGDQFVFTGGNRGGTYYIQRRPTTQEVLLGSGVLADATGQNNGDDIAVQLQIQAQVCAALNRHVLATPANWYTASQFYPAGQKGNFYAKFWHDHAINALAYGFAYDDVGGFSPSVHTDSPSVVTFSIGW
jgi:hypothetical protein